MLNKLLKLTLVVWAIGCDTRADAPPDARDQKGKPLLKCAMRLTGKIKGTSGGKPYTLEEPDAAEVTITNISNVDVDIRSPMGSWAHLDLRVKDPAGAHVETEPLSSLRSTGKKKGTFYFLGTRHSSRKSRMSPFRC